MENRDVYFASLMPCEIKEADERLSMSLSKISRFQASLSKTSVVYSNTYCKEISINLVANWLFMRFCPSVFF